MRPDDMRTYAASKFHYTRSPSASDRGERDLIKRSSGTSRRQRDN